MRENNTAVTMTPMTEYIVDGDKLYLKTAQSPPDNSSTVAKSKDPPKKPGKSKPRSDE